MSFMVTGKIFMLLNSNVWIWIDQQHWRAESDEFGIS